MDSNRAGSPLFESLGRSDSALRTSQASTTGSSSSPEITTDAGITPDSENDESPTIVPKIEELDENSFADVEETKPTTTDELVLPRKRGRPRKHPVVEQKKVAHARSKTGCGTCRRRKKKCDETKPTCLNCEKNNVVCDGYQPKQLWRNGRQKSFPIGNAVPADLPLLVDGVDGTVDQLFFHHFTCQISKVLSLTDQQNPFLELIVPMAMSHTGLMHSLLYLSGSCLIASETGPHYDWEQRSAHHSSKAMRLLQQDLASTTLSDADPVAVATVADPSITQTLLLCLQTVCAGDLTGAYRFHLNAMKEMLTTHKQALPNEQLRQFILEFLIYHDYSSSITSLVNPLDERSIALMENFRLPEFIIQPQAGTLLGVLDGLFSFISRIRNLRDQLRQRRALPLAHWWDDEIMNEAFAIDEDLRQWTCMHPPDSPRFAASLLYRQCTWIYLHRTIQLSQSSQTFHQAVEEGLVYLRMVQSWDRRGSGEGASSSPSEPSTPTPPPPPSSSSSDDSTQSILLMPLFLLGCAAFDPDQRPEILNAFQRLQEWSSLGNIKYARIIVEQIWEMMDQGREEETWDWETIIANRGWDFLVT